MVKKILQALVLSMLSYAVNAEEELTGPIVIDSNNYNELVVDKETLKNISDKPWFIKFYAPWCGHCKRLAPVWDELHDLHVDELNVAKVDCTSDFGRLLCTDFEIRGYPTLYYLPSA